MLARFNTWNGSCVYHLFDLFLGTLHQIRQNELENARSFIAVWHSCSCADTTCLRYQIQHLLYILIRQCVVIVDLILNMCFWRYGCCSIYSQAGRKWKDWGRANKEEINKIVLKMGCFCWSRGNVLIRDCRAPALKMSFQHLPDAILLNWLGNGPNVLLNAI